MSGVADHACARSATAGRRILLILLLFASCKEARITEVPVEIASVDLTAPQTSVLAGQTIQLNATPRSASGQGLTARTVTWSSDNSSVASVNGSGLVTGVSGGSATITARAGSATRSVEITVIAVYTLTVTGAGTGNGSVTGSGINCTISAGTASGTCQATYSAGTAVTLTATPAGGGHTLTSWSGCAPTPTNCTVNMTANRTVTVTFSAPTPPTITTVSSRVVQINVPANVCPTTGPLFSLFEHIISYTDPNGDVPDPVSGTVGYAFSPSGATGSFALSAERNGTGASGTIELLTCYLFGSSTAVAQAVLITDASNRQSNTVTVIFQKPAGANSLLPGGIPLALPHAGKR